MLSDLEIYVTIQMNRFSNLNKYIVQFEQICYTIGANKKNAQQKHVPPSLSPPLHLSSDLLLRFLIWIFVLEEEQT